MQCEDARASLFEYADGSLSAAERERMTAHLEQCPSCAGDFEVITDLARQASVWHDEPVPDWRPPRVAPPAHLTGFRQWFPSLASALALILVISLYLQPQPAAVEPPSAATAGQPAGAPDTGGPGVINASLETALSRNRLERRQELQALVALLRAEMDQRSEETQESLRYVIAHQLQGQREIDDLYHYIRKVGGDPSADQRNEAVPAADVRIEPKGRM